jgi:hypothetical protein
MKYTDVVEAIGQLSLQERLALFEILVRSIRLDFAALTGDKPYSELLHGILHVTGIDLSDEELREDYTNYLLRKYA